MATSVVGMEKRGRRVPMRVLCFGFPRTGTLSARTALLQLGFTDCYHYHAWIQNPSHTALWERAYEAKFLHKGSFSREDWDELLGDYQATTDNPCVYFAPELICTYPTAKVILQKRPFPAWYASFRATIVTFIYDPLFTYLCYLDPGMSQWWPVSRNLHFDAFGGSFERENAIAVHERGMEQVRALVPKENLLEWGVEDGWEPLCAFLGVRVPEGGFPRVNDGRAFAEMMGDMRRGLVWELGKRVGGWGTGLGVVGVGIWWAVR